MAEKRSGNGAQTRPGAGNLLQRIRRRPEGGGIAADAGMDDLITFVNDVYEDEQAGELFEQEEVDLLGTLAQEKAESLAALVAQAADALGVTLELE